MFASESYRNCLETERLLMQDIRNAELPARDRAICANALDRILERKRILRMKPAPKAVDADKYQEQKRRRAAYQPACVELVETELAPIVPKQQRSDTVKRAVQDIHGCPDEQSQMAKDPSAQERQSPQVKTLRERLMDT